MRDQIFFRESVENDEACRAASIELYEARNLQIIVV
jgi:hypothetical protein